LTHFFQAAFTPAALTSRTAARPLLQEVRLTQEVAVQRVPQLARVGLVEEEEIAVEETLRLLHLVLGERVGLELRDSSWSAARRRQPVFVLHRPQPDG